MDNIQSPAQQNILFLGDVSAPFCSSKITKGLVEFYVRPTKSGKFVPEKRTELIDQDGQSHAVAIRSIGYIIPDLAANTWQPGDFLIRIEGITMDQAVSMRHLRQTQESE